VIADPRPTSVQLADVTAERDRLREFAEWCARLDQSGPEGQAVSALARQVAVAARAVLA
jgi:hypothetical protein